MSGSPALAGLCGARPSSAASVMVRRIPAADKRRLSSAVFPAGAAEPKTRAFICRSPLQGRQSRKRGLLSAGALCRGGRAGRFYHDTKRRSHPPAVRYYHFIAALFSITAEKCKDFFCLFPDFRKAGIWGWTGAGRRKAQGGSGERCLWESGAMLRCSGGMEGRCCGETCGTESRAGTEVRRGKAICYFRARAASFAKLSVAWLPAAVFSGQVRHMCTLLSDCRERL